MVDRRVCCVCGNRSWRPFLNLSGSGRIMTGDQRIIPGTLEKVICTGCGVVANSRPLTQEEINRLYGEAYVLNTKPGEEHLFFTREGPKARSEVFFEWLSKYLPTPLPKRVHEIGCGAGNVLTRFRGILPDARLSGWDGSEAACELARSHGLDVRQNLICTGREELPESDVIYAINVLEHAEQPEYMLQVLSRGVAPGGRMLLTLPVQDAPNHDLLFAEHAWHFTIRHVQQLLHRCGWRVVAVEAEHPVNHGIGLFVCEHDRGQDSMPELPSPNGESLLANRERIIQQLSYVNKILEKNAHRRIALFGASETTTLLLAFSDLSQVSLRACIDEDPNRIGQIKHGLPIYSPDWLSRGDVDLVLLTIHPKYHEQVKQKLARYGMDVISAIL